MFSGITRGLYEVVALQRRSTMLHYTVNLSKVLVSNLKTGYSIAVDGVCQTVVKIKETHVSFEAIEETLRKTTLKTLGLGDFVSIERSLRWGEEIGGHEVAGHVFGTAVIHQKIIANENLNLIIRCEPTWMKYVLPKGFIAVDGCSLTIGQTHPAQGLFYLHLIPETLRLTNFSRKKVNDEVNIEFDHKTKTIVDTVIALLPSLLRTSASPQ